VTSSSSSSKAANCFFACLFLQRTRWPQHASSAAAAVIRGHQHRHDVSHGRLYGTNLLRGALAALGTLLALLLLLLLHSLLPRVQSTSCICSREDGCCFCCASGPWISCWLLPLLLLDVMLLLSCRQSLPAPTRQGCMLLLQSIPPLLLLLLWLLLQLSHHLPRQVEPYAGRHGLQQLQLA
jgi:hypothetical protein